MERQLQMRMSKEAMARHHDEIVAAASRMLRERGIEGTSVADLMQAAGLTHGGFYRHFESEGRARGRGHRGGLCWHARLN